MVVEWFPGKEVVEWFDLSRYFSMMPLGRGGGDHVTLMMMEGGREELLEDRTMD